MIDKITCGKEAKICAERFSFCKMQKAIMKLNIKIILDFYGMYKSNEHSKMLDSISK